MAAYTKFPYPSLLRVRSHVTTSCTYRITLVSYVSTSLRLRLETCIVAILILSSSIVAVHGLNPLNKLDHGEDTWRAPKSQKSWLRDFLPQDIPSARIILFGYNSNVAFSSGNEGVCDQANTLCFTLGGYREDVQHRPIVFIAHSLGGLVVKQVRL